MLKRLDLRGLTGDDLRAALPRPEVAGDEPVAAVREIVAAVRERGDAALRELTERFDGVRVERPAVAPARLQQALSELPGAVREALEVAAARIRSYHETQRRNDQVHTDGGVTVEALTRPVRRAGIYVPGGRAAYPSTVLMTAIPARVAGVREVVLCVPPDRATGEIAAVTLAAAAVAGVDEVYAIGGAQAIAAMAYGTESLERVDVIAGPGNVYVAVAKREVAGAVGIAAAFAGPSEVVVVADETTPASLAAIDVILQAEHGPNGVAWLISWSEAAAEAIDREVERLTEAAPRRSEISSTLAAGGFLALVDGPAQAITVANLIAPEHLELLCDDPRSLLAGVQNAGAVFCGAYSPASIGDYLAGPSHVLPTDGSARFAGALTVADFTKDVHVVTVAPEGFAAVADHVIALAEAEGLEAHAESIRLRRSPP